MGLSEQLGGGLAEVQDLLLDALAESGIIDGLQIDGSLVGQVVEHVGGTNLKIIG